MLWLFSYRGPGIFHLGSGERGYNFFTFGQVKARGPIFFPVRSAKPIRGVDTCSIFCHRPLQEFPQPNPHGNPPLLNHCINHDKYDNNTERPLLKDCSSCTVLPVFSKIHDKKYHENIILFFTRFYGTYFFN